MGSFPVTYDNTTISGKGQNVPLNVDTRTGADYVAQGMAQLGQAFDTVQQRYDTAELSTMKRQLDEMTSATLDTYSQTGDEKARKALVEKWSQDSDAIQSKSQRVNYVFRLHKDNVIPQWADQFNKQELIIKDRTAGYAALQNMNALIEAGDLAGAKKIIDENVKLGTTGFHPSQAVAYMEQAKAKTLLAQKDAEKQAVLAKNEHYYQQAISLDTPEKQMNFINSISATEIDETDRNALKSRIGSDYNAKVVAEQSVYDNVINTHSENISKLLYSENPDPLTALQEIRNINDSEVPLKYRDNLLAFKVQWTQHISSMLDGQRKQVLEGQEKTVLSEIAGGKKLTLLDIQKLAPDVSPEKQQQMLGWNAPDAKKVIEEKIVTEQDSRIKANEVVLAYKEGKIDRPTALKGIGRYQSTIEEAEFKTITNDIYKFADNADPIKQRMVNEYNRNLTYLATKRKLAPDSDVKTNMMVAIQYQRSFNEWFKNNSDASEIDITDKYKNLTKGINLWWDTPEKDLREAQNRTGSLFPTNTTVTWKYTATDATGKKVGSNDGVKWQPIQ
jgi:hypothetical protein